MDDNTSSEERAFAAIRNLCADYAQRLGVNHSDFQLAVCLTPPSIKDQSSYQSWLRSITVWDSFGAADLNNVGSRGARQPHLVYLPVQEDGAGGGEDLPEARRRGAGGAGGAGAARLSSKPAVLKLRVASLAFLSPAGAVKSVKLVPDQLTEDLGATTFTGPVGRPVLDLSAIVDLAALGEMKLQKLNRQLYEESSRCEVSVGDVVMRPQSDSAFFSVGSKVPVKRIEELSFFNIGKNGDNAQVFEATLSVAATLGVRGPLHDVQRPFLVGAGGAGVARLEELPTIDTMTPKASGRSARETTNRETLLSVAGAQISINKNGAFVP